MPPIRKQSKRTSECEWYFENAVIGTIEGPYTVAEMKGFWDTKRINEECRVWHSKLCRDWRSIRTLTLELRTQIFGNNLHHQTDSLTSFDLPNLPLKSASARSSKAGLQSTQRKRRTALSPRKKRRMISPRTGSLTPDMASQVPCLERTMSAQSAMSRSRTPHMMSATMTPDRMRYHPSSPVIPPPMFVERRPPFHPCLKYGGHYPGNPVIQSHFNRHNAHPFVYNAVRHNSPPRALTKQPMTVFSPAGTCPYASPLRTPDTSPVTPQTPSKLGRHPPPGFFPDHLLPKPKLSHSVSLSPLYSKSMSMDAASKKIEKEELTTDTTLSSSRSSLSKTPDMIDDSTLMISSPVYISDASLVKESPQKVRHRISQRRRKRELSMARSMSVHSDIECENIMMGKEKKCELGVYSKRGSLESSVSLGSPSPYHGLSLGKPVTFVPCSDGSNQYLHVLKQKLKKKIQESEYRLQCDIRNRFAEIHAQIDTAFNQIND